MDVKALAADASSRLAYVRRGYPLRSRLSEITNGLKLYEKLSAIFLLCETSQAGLIIMEEILSDSNTTYQNNVFYKWLEQVPIFTAEDWKSKLAELLVILQNYKLAKTLGYTKNYLMEKFLPKNNFKTYWIPAIRIVLYNLCEQLNFSETSALITMMEDSQDSVDPIKDKYLEYKLLKWSESGIITLDIEKAIDLCALTECLKSLNLSTIIHDVEVMIEKTNCVSVRSKCLLKFKLESSEYYKIINENCLGLCVIINEKNFSSNLFPRRLGTDKDVERVTEVFTAFGFDIKLHVDLTFEQLVNTLALYAKTVDKTSSFFVLIILSHGSENVIYTSDSLPIDMNTIEMIFQAELCPNLLGKPKIFIVQSCQGEKWQRLIQDAKPDIEADASAVPASNDSVLVGPQRGDSMIAWSTVQGFASFRDKYNGSWYIQELCDQLWKFGDAMDLVEILTKVNNNLRSKVYGGQFMVPSLLLSLRAKVQFPKLVANYAKGRKLMFERLTFDKYFREFLISGKFPHSKFVFKRGQ